VFGQFHRIVQDAVDAVADEERFFERFNVNVGRILRIRMADECIDDAHGGDAFCHLFQIHFFLLARRDELGSGLLERSRLAPDDVAEVVLESLLVLLERSFNRVDIREARQDLEVRLLFYEIYRGQVIGVEHRDFELFRAVIVGDDVVATGDGLGNH